MRPVRAVDGEADPPDAEGRQNYNLLVAGGKALRPQFSPALHSVEVFEFLLSLPPEPYLVGYYIGFDVTHWLKDVPIDKCESIFYESSQAFGNYTWWKQYGIWYVPGQFFRVCRTTGGGRPSVIKNTARTINEVSGFWRGPFVDMLRTMGVATPGELAEIDAGKAARGQVQLEPEQVERYCKLECRLLAKAVTKLRGLFEDVGYPLRDYRGAGAAAGAILNEQPQIPKAPAGQPGEKNGPTRPARIDVAHEQHRYPDNTQWRQAVMTAMFGGRIETRATGEIDSPILEYDRRGSYCAGLRELPCPRHTNWVKFRGEPKGWKWYLAQGSWQTKERIPWGPLPARTPTQSIIYPMSVAGWWWSPELEGLDGFEFKGGWGADRDCNCDPFDFIDEIYAERLRLDEMAGLPLKIAMAAITGRFAQRKHGRAPWRDLVIAGLIYSQTRAAVRELLDDNTLQVATDAVYTTKTLAVKQTPELGNWAVTEIKNGLLIVQPGIFFNRDLSLIRARGFSKKTLIDRVEELRRAWNAWNPLLPTPSVTVPVELFIGHKAGVMLHGGWGEDGHRPDMIGRWKTYPIPLSFDWQGRRHAAFELRDKHVVTFAPERHQKSVPYDPSAISELERRELMLREQPDG